MADEVESIWKALDPLKQEIRLFLLAPSAAFDVDLTGRLISVSLVEKEIVSPYLAVSHAWGQAQKSAPLYVEGQRLHITIALWYCLKCFRSQENEIALWIDAICIDQSSLEERAQQVSLMRHIFSQAEEVRVWLGFGLPILEDLMLDIAETGKVLEVPPHDSIERFLCQIMLFNRLDWWHRLWVKQEVALARTIRLFYGRLSVTIEDLQNWKQHVLKPIRDRVQDPAYHKEIYNFRNNVYMLTELRWLLSRLEARSEDRSTQRLVEILATSREAYASDIRDRVYGQLGIIETILQQELLQPDYSLSASEVFVNFAYKLCSATRTLDVLNQVSSSRNAIGSLPTWVPDWSSRHNFYWVALRLRYLDCYTATRNLDMPDPSLRGKSQLGLQGHCFDELELVCEYCEEYGDPSNPLAATQYLEVVGKWKRLYEGEVEQQRILRRDSDGQDFLAQFSRVMFRDLHRSKQNKPVKRIPRFLTALQILEEIETAWATEEYLPVIHHIKRLSHSIADSRFFITRSGRSGLGPLEMRSGDQVAMLLGGRVPYILRKSRHASEPNVYTFVGECYVHGVMDGEAFDENKVHEIWLE